MVEVRKTSQENISVVVRGSSPKEEFEYLKRTVRKMSFYLEHGYIVGLPEVEELKTDIIFKDEKESFKVFLEKEYDIEFFAEGVKEIERRLPVVRSCFTKLIELNNRWSFKLFSTYEVLLTKYGPDGSYDDKSGKITMLVTKNGKFKRDAPEQTIIHEIVHMGIEDCIVKTFKLSHQEKEVLVDLLVKTLYSDVFPNYRVQSFTDPGLRRYVNNETITALPTAIKSYIVEFPR